MNYQKTIMPKDGYGLTVDTHSMAVDNAERMHGHCFHQTVLF